MEQPKPLTVPLVAKPDKAAIRANIKRHMDVFSAAGLKCGVSLVNSDMTSVQNVVGYAAYIDVLRELGCEIIAVSAMLAQVGIINAQQVTQFTITYALPVEAV